MILDDTIVPNCAARTYRHVTSDLDKGPNRAVVTNEAIVADDQARPGDSFGTDVTYQLISLCFRLRVLFCSSSVHSTVKYSY